MRKLTQERIRDLLAAEPAPAPPADLADRLKRQIPDGLEAAPGFERPRRPRSSSWRPLLLAASLVLAAGTAFLTVRLERRLASSPPPPPPATSPATTAPAPSTLAEEVTLAESQGLAEAERGEVVGRAVEEARADRVGRDADDGEAELAKAAKVDRPREAIEERSAASAAAVETADEVEVMAEVKAEAPAPLPAARQKERIAFADARDENEAVELDRAADVADVLGQITVTAETAAPAAAPPRGLRLAADREDDPLPALRAELEEVLNRDEAGRADALADLLVRLRKLAAERPQDAALSELLRRAEEAAAPPPP